jgi:hypothetical protein
MPSPLLQPITATATLAAGVATEIDLNLNGSTNWTIVLRNTGGNAVTALTVAVSPLGTLFEAAASITTGIPLAGGTSLAAIVGSSEPARTVRLTATSTVGTTVSVEALGL